MAASEGNALRGGFFRVAAVVLIFCMISLPFGALAAKPKPLDLTKTTSAEKAPDFILTDLKGQQFRLSDHRGKRPVLIIFSATWCTFCKAEIPHFKSLHATYTKLGLEVVNIDIQESQEKVSKFAAQNQLPYRVLLDRDGAVSGIYDVRGVPMTVLVDRDGMIVCRQCRTVETLLDSMMKH
ncbi:MAG: TlpA family protein disulfide reductase [Syntrophales bacterium]